jgi:hypothetical protein
MKKHDWTAYTFNRSQLLQYIQTFTGIESVSVVSGNSPSTHLPTSSVNLPVGAPNAQDVAAHEGLHIKETDAKAMRKMRTGAEQRLLNCLEDARMERHSFHESPGLRVQFQDNIVDAYMPVILEEDWLVQSLKGTMLVTAGYTFPRGKFKPKAKKLLDKFDPLVPEIRACKNTMELVPLIPKVIALFDEFVEDKPKPQPKPEDDEDNVADEDGEFESSPIPGPPVNDPRTGEPMQHYDNDDCPACDEIDRQERDSERLDRANAPRPSSPAPSTASPDEEGEDKYEGEDDSFEGEPGADSPYTPTTYDADEASEEMLDAQKKGQTREAKPTAEPPAPSDGFDKVTGGRSVNRLKEQATRLDKAMRRLDALTHAAPAGTPEYAVQQSSQVSGLDGASSAYADNMPKASKDLVNIDAKLEAKDRYGYSTPQYHHIDYKSLFSKGSNGGVAYMGRDMMRLVDARKVRSIEVADYAEETDLRLRATVNFLARQMTVFLQSQEKTGLRDRERTGKLDPTRAYQMGGGRFDVYKNPPEYAQARPVVVLTTDMSGSMGAGINSIGPHTRGRGSNAIHAMAATILLAQALKRLGVPFECHGFSSSDLLVMKTFSQRTDTKTIRALSNTAAMGGGGTPAAEALAFAWARACTRPEQRKIVIQVTDGSVPENTKNFAKAITNDGGIVIGVGIGSTNVEKTFANHVNVSSAGELPNRFARLLKSLVLKGEFAGGQR